MLLDILKLIERMETEIGNGVNISITTMKDPHRALRLRAFWADGIVYQYVFDPIELHTANDQEDFVYYFISICKRAYINHKKEIK